MWCLLGFVCLLSLASVQAFTAPLTDFEKSLFPDGAAHDYPYVKESKDFWKVVFNTYYGMQGLRNETTEKLVESFFDHPFEAYPKELYPAFERIFTHISKSNDRIWNFYESILYFYHNVDAADRVYETVLRRHALGTLLDEPDELDALSPLEEASRVEVDNLEHRTGAIIKEVPISEEEQQPCQDECGIPPLQVGSIRAIPGEHFPNYEEIPITSFTCAGKHIPGFYADLDTGCQVFHVCYSHRRESFLCPIGTTFNQAILACDYWYSSNCSLAPLYFPSGLHGDDENVEGGEESIVDDLLGQYGTTTPASYPADPSKKGKKPKSPKIKITLPNIDWTLMIKFLPIKSKITECPDFCEKTTTTTTATYPTQSTPSSTVSTSTAMPSTRPIVTPTVATVPPKKRDYDEKAAKSEMLLNILKAVEVLTKDAESFLTKIVKEKSRHDILVKKPTVAPHLPTEKPKPFPEINPRFIVKPVKVVRHLPRPSISRSKLIKPSKPISKSKMDDLLRKKDPAKLVLEGMKAIAHLLD